MGFMECQQTYNATSMKMAVGVKSCSDEVGIIKSMYEGLIMISELVNEICNI